MKLKVTDNWGVYTYSVGREDLVADKAYTFTFKVGGGLHTLRGEWVSERVSVKDHGHEYPKRSCRLLVWVPTVFGEVLCPIEQLKGLVSFQSA